MIFPDRPTEQGYVSLRNICLYILNHKKMTVQTLLKQFNLKQEQQL